MSVYSYDGQQKALIYDYSGGVRVVAYDVVGNNILQTTTHTFSILGDSYSTFNGYIDEDNKTWYPNDNNDVKKVEQTWWHLLSKQTGMELKTNESRSGSTICYNGWGEGTADATNTAFIARMNKLETADYIFVFGGTNDSWIGVEIGEYKYADWTEADKETFRPALAYLLDSLVKAHPNSHIVFIMNTELNANIVASIETVCGHYNIDLLKLSNISKQGGHPDITGMIAIKDQLCDFLNL